MGGAIFGLFMAIIDLFDFFPNLKMSAAIRKRMRRYRVIGWMVFTISSGAVWYYERILGNKLSPQMIVLLCILYGIVALTQWLISWHFLQISKQEQ